MLRWKRTNRTQCFLGLVIYRQCVLRCSPGANQSAGSMSRDHLKSNRIALFVSRDLQPAVLNRAVHKQSLSNTVLITVWRLAESRDCPVMSQIRSYPEHVTFIFRYKVSISKDKMSPNQTFSMEKMKKLMIYSPFMPLALPKYFDWATSVQQRHLADSDICLSATSVRQPN